jgi:hypothetical protein
MKKRNTKTVSLQQSKERKARNQFLGCLAFVVWFLIGGTVIMGFIWHDTLRDRRNALLLQSQGQTTTGFVIDKYTEDDPDSATTYHIVYRFRAPGPNGESDAFDDTWRVYSSTYNRLQIEDAITITYVPNDPTISTAENPPEDPPSTTFLVVLSIITIVVVLPPLAFVVLVVYGAIRQRIRGKPLTFSD